MIAPRFGVRVRTTALATVVLGVAVTAAALLLYAGLGRVRLQEVDAAAGLLATDLAGQIQAGRLDPRAAPVGNDVLVQVVDPAGRVALASPAIPSGHLLVEHPLAAGARLIATAGDLGQGRHAHRLLAIGVQGPGGSWTIAVATSLEFVDRTTHRAAVALAVGTPLLVLLVAFSTWFVVGRALAPVENIRRSAARVRGSALAARVPVPPVDDEIARLARTVNDMLDRLEAASRRQQAFAADASHELRTPLTAARGELELALAQPATADWPATARATLRGLSRLEQLVADLLLMTRADEDALLRSEDVDLDDLVLAEVTRLREVAPDLTVLVDDVEPARARGDVEALRRVLRNLGDNAARHAAALVTLSLRRDGAMAELRVVDDGPGVPAADRDRIFERFVRLDEGRDRHGGGTGLGLALCRAVVTAHHGTIAVEGPGATFVVRLPLS